MIHLGIDLGYGYLKATDGKRHIKFPALVGAGRDLLNDELFGSAPKYDVEMDFPNGEKRHVFVGELARRESSDATLNLTTQKHNDVDTEALWLTTLALFALEYPAGEKIKVVTGLPLQQYGTQKDALKAKLESLEADVTIGGKTVHVKAESVEVVAQAMGAMFAALIDPLAMTLRYPELSQRRGYSLLVDVGRRTTGFVVFETYPEFQVVSSLSDSVDRGVHNYFLNLAQVFRARTGETPRLENVALYEELAQTGKTFYTGREVSVDPERENYVQQFGDAIMKSIVAKVGADNFAQIHTAFAAGGGYSLVENTLKKSFANAYVVEGDPQMANAVGYSIVCRTRG